MSEKSAWRVLCLWDVAPFPNVLDALRDVASIEVCSPGHALVSSTIHQDDALLTSLKLTLDRTLIARATRVKTVVTPSTGLDHLDLEALREHGVELQSLKVEFDLLDQISATAELAWALLLAVARLLPVAHQAAIAGRWARDEFRGTQIRGKTIGIVGGGPLGSMIAQYWNVFGLRVLGCDPGKESRCPSLTMWTWRRCCGRPILSRCTFISPRKLGI